ncbi:MAG: guanylate kinase [Polyangiaceae bacterium]|nr:guanylate kinase [Polyangiaceae bacterium]
MSSDAAAPGTDTPLLLIVSSPSGAGKTTLTGRLLAREAGIRFSVSHTTRSPRATELNGREYHFVDRDAFEAMAARGAFVEWAEVHGNLYGTARAELARLPLPRAILFDIDHQGARQIKARIPDAVSVFILPPSMAELERRLRGRASDDEPTVQRRFRAARDEIAHYGQFDYVLVNQELDVATEQLVSVLRAEECRRRRAARHAEALLGERRGG